MRRGTKIGWALVAFSILLSVWVIAGGSISNADEDTPDPAGESGSVEPIDGGLFDSGLDGYSETTDADGNTTFNFGDGTTGYYNAADGSMTYYDADGSYYIQYADGTGKQFDKDGNEVELLGGTPSLYAAQTDYTINGSTLVVNPGSTTISEKAYQSSGTVTTIEIPASVTYIDPSAFDNCTGVKEIKIASDNPNYIAYDGVVYEKTTGSGWILTAYPMAKTEVTISNETMTIDEAVLNYWYEQAKLGNISINLTQENSRIENILQTYLPEGSDGNPGISYSIDGVTPGTTPVDPTPDNPTPTPPSGGGGAVAGGGVPVIPSNGTTPATTNGTTTDATTADGSANTSASAATGTTHDKDATPTTADGDIDPRYILVLAVFLAGIGMIIYGQQGKYKYMTENRRK